MADSKYFTTTKKGEIAELRTDLASEKKDKKKDAVKKVIANMTVGKDVSCLFPDVINCMQTENAELKKLVYLYLTNYAKAQPDHAIMAVNTFVKDCDDPNPLIRALAVRTMGCIRVDKITEYLCEPLRKCLKDEDPYVRKTAAVCVAKLHDINADLVEDQGFLDSLRDLVADDNPMVVSNTIAALTEISETHPTSAGDLQLTPATVNKLLTAVNECSEWGQIFILDCLARYVPRDTREARSTADRVTARLSHANSGVVLSSMRLLLRLVGFLDGEEDYIKTLLQKMAPPLVTMLSSEPEIQYVGLRNINLIVQKYGDILENDIKVFFVKYNDPIYVKLEKLDIMIRLTTEKNITHVLPELKEYAAEVDVDFVRKAVRAIGRCAIKVVSQAERCVQTLVELISTKVNYVVQEAIVVIKDIFRKYPNRYENIISVLCENLDSLDEPEARASMIWILGEYAERIDNAHELLRVFIDNFNDEIPQVQLQLLTSAVKLFLLRPADGQDIVQSLLSTATQDSDNPDLRDRAYIYWRLLSTDPVAAKEVVLSEKPLISEETDLLEPSLLEELLSQIPSLASVYHKPPSTFVEGRVPLQFFPHSMTTATADTVSEPDPTVESAAPATSAGESAVADTGNVGTVLDLGTPAPTNTGHAEPSGAPIVDLLGDLTDLSLTHLAYEAPKAVWLQGAKSQGMEISGTFARRHGQLFMDLTITNQAMSAFGNLAIQYNRNSFGIAPASLLEVNIVPPCQSVATSLPLNFSGQVGRMDPLNLLHVAVKNNIGIYYFTCLVPFHVLFVEGGNMERKAFLSTWKEIPGSSEVQSVITGVNADAVRCEAHLQRSNVFAVAKRSVENYQLLYLSAQLTNGIWILAELKFSPGSSTVNLALKTRTLDIVPGVQEAFAGIMRSV
ncbi:AP-1 complex subunit beta-1-like [Sycon ciliatum]|uniref:AP-1 complex subunit beta-1-like n=1 Tax=Sycon ciliatum TaxID=27933 RepID=UPI0020AAC735|eukprot:scpid47017/ scgid23649/ AP-1 complex subunit beta-1; Adapter-related protein complex 1 subunit beta-1; Adaptor protein complex AP-1 subunit beta-1; Beta-1-adaptin; Beta-adaptin 1; Clathrin assembly protein complex 1 beta large chain; Golgi adaptor HA1/AP1 adaptin beta subunit